MALQYRTEYSLGQRGRVCRTYSGLQALIAIAFDLAWGLIFGLVGLGLWAVRRCVVTAYRATVVLVVTAYRVGVALVGLPLGLIRAVSGARSGRPVAKPAWAALDEW